MVIPEVSVFIPVIWIGTCVGVTVTGDWESEYGHSIHYEVVG